MSNANFLSCAGQESPYALVATVRYLLLVDLCSGSVTPIENNRSEYYGITWRPNSDALILGHSGTDNSAMIDIESYASSETGWISEGEIDSPAFLSAPHQILLGSDGRVICTNTGRNCITVIDLSKPGIFHEHRVSSARWDRLSIHGETADHLNSVFERDGRLYVLAHAHRKGSFVSVLRYPELVPIETWPRMRASGLHNIWVDSAGRAISCHSSAGAIIDVKTSDVLWQSGSPVYLRGLAASSGFLVVGESEMTGRDLRRSSHSGLWIIDRQTWEAVDYLSLGPYGAVNEVRLVNIPDDAHHGACFSGLASIIANSISKHTRDGRLRTARRHHTARSVWRGYDDVFGAYTTDEGGRRVASSETLCLATLGGALPPESTFSLSVDYALSAHSDSSHVSLVLGYDGGGSDSHMSAVLIQSSGSDARLSFWVNDGKAWRTEGIITASAVPLAGTITVESSGSRVRVCAAGRSFEDIPASLIIPGQGRLGIRWIGASVIPVNM